MNTETDPVDDCLGSRQESVKAYLADDGLSTTAIYQCATVNTMNGDKPFTIAKAVVDLMRED